MQWGTTLGDQNLSLQTVPFGVTVTLSWRPLKRDRCSKTPPRRGHPSAHAQQKFLQIGQGQESLSWGKFHGHKEGGEPVPQMELPKHAPYSTGSPMCFPPYTWPALEAGNSASVLCTCANVTPKCLPLHNSHPSAHHSFEMLVAELCLWVWGTCYSSLFSSWSSVVLESPSWRTSEGPGISIFFPPSPTLLQDPELDPGAERGRCRKKW